MASGPILSMIARYVVRRSPAERREGRIELLGEQDGPAQCELKALLRAEFRRFNRSSERISHAWLQPGCSRFGRALYSSELHGRRGHRGDGESNFLFARCQRCSSRHHFSWMAGERDLQRVCRSFL